MSIKKTWLCFPLSISGMETTSTTIEWILHFLASNPSSQKKLQSEVDQIVGQSRLPSLVDRPQMPYAEAIITEILRITSLAPLGTKIAKKLIKIFQFYRLFLND